MKIQLTKLPPAPLVDGFDLREYSVGVLGETYDVDPKLGRYLIAAGYAEPAALPLADAADRPRQRKRRDPALS